jgi:hypothetical protein
VALFVLLLVGIVVAQTWVDWRHTRVLSPIPDWAKGIALASVVAVTFASAANYATAWLAGEPTSIGAATRLFWPELAFLLCAMGAIVVAVRQKRLRFLLAFAGIVIAAFLVGMTLSR